MFKKIILAITLIFSGLFISSCEYFSRTREIIEPTEGNVVEPRAFYNNKFDEEKIPNQWEGYGIGDPFVMRFNGKYYLYASTKNSQDGIRGWVSDDLINWIPAETNGLPFGYVTNNQVTNTAYAPEVIYFDGYFYMATSPMGRGHYFLKADNPLGPFEPISENLGESIDGSFFLDDDEKMYFLRASNNGIRIVEVDTDDFTLKQGRTLDNTIIGNWTEGPFMIKRAGIYYLTFTGTSVVSAGYKIAYSTSTTSPFERSAFNFNGNIALSTTADFNGLGHSSTVLGPDLDSYYIAYHNLNSTGGPNRSFNLGRLLFNGRQMTINNLGITRNISPELPDYYQENGEDLLYENEIFLSEEEHQDVFSLEYNFIGEGSIMFAYRDNDYLELKVKENGITLVSNQAGEVKEIKDVTFNKTYDMSKLHTIRVAYRDEKLDVYFDNMNKILDLEIAISKGRIGYKNIFQENIFATVISSTAKGLSDQQEIKQGLIGASLYDNYDSNLSTASKIVVQEEDLNDDNLNLNVGALDLIIGKKNDYASYLIDVPATGYYGISMKIHRSMIGKNIGLQIDEASKLKVKVPKISTDAKYVEIRLTELKLPKGVHRLKLYNLGSSLRFQNFSLFETTNNTPNFEDDLASFVLKGAYYVNAWKLKDDGHYAVEGNRQLMYFGDDKFTDLAFSVDIKLIGSTQTRTAGVVLRAKNPAFSVYDSYESIQAYYVGFNNHKLFIHKYNYNMSEYDLNSQAISFESDKNYNLKVVVKGNLLEVYIDDELIMNYYDNAPFMSGRIGFYTEGASAVYTNLKII